MFAQEQSLREELANLEHDRWSRWMTYLFSMSVKNSDGSVTIPAGYVRHWQRQLETPYQDLTDSEKESDRCEADRVLSLINRWFAEKP